MSPESPPPLSKDLVSTYLYFGSLYFVSVGVLYSWGYWSTFNVNILEYVGLADIVKATAYPIATAGILTLVGAVLGEALSGEHRLPSGGGRDTRVGKFLRKIGPALAVLYITGTLALLIFGPVKKWLVLPVLFAVPFYAFAKQKGFLQRLIPHDAPRSIVIYMLCTLPLLSYGRGLMEANAIVVGTRFDYVMSEVDGVPLAKVSPDVLGRLRYLGHANQHFFFLQPWDNGVVVSKFGDGKSLVLQHHQSKSASAPTDAAIPPSAAASSASAASP